MFIVGLIHAVQFKFYPIVDFIHDRATANFLQSISNVDSVFDGFV